MSSNEEISNKDGVWYIAEIIEKLEPINKNESNELRRVTTWGNHHLIKAGSPDQAYEKAVKIGEEGEFSFVNSNKVEMRYVFVGVGDLLPIYEDKIEDGAELMWTDYGQISNRRTLKMKRSKEDILQNFKAKRK